MKKTKLKSIQEMWTTLQDLSTKNQLTEVERVILDVCVNFFRCSEDFIKMFEDCVSVLEEIDTSEVTSSTQETAVKRTSPTFVSQDPVSAVLGMTIGGTLEGLQSHPQEGSDAEISSELEEAQLMEFHEMMAGLDSEVESDG